MVSTSCLTACFVFLGAATAAWGCDCPPITAYPNTLSNYFHVSDTAIKVQLSSDIAPDNSDYSFFEAEVLRAVKGEMSTGKIIVKDGKSRNGACGSGLRKGQTWILSGTMESTKVHGYAAPAIPVFVVNSCATHNKRWTNMNKWQRKLATLYGTGQLPQCFEKDCFYKSLGKPAQCPDGVSFTSYSSSCKLQDGMCQQVIKSAPCPSCGSHSDCQNGLQCENGLCSTSSPSAEPSSRPTPTVQTTPSLTPSSVGPSYVPSTFPSFAGSSIIIKLALVVPGLAVAPTGSELQQVRYPVRSYLNQISRSYRQAGNEAVPLTLHEIIRAEVGAGVPEAKFNFLLEFRSQVWSDLNIRDLHIDDMIQSQRNDERFIQWVTNHGPSSLANTTGVHWFPYYIYNTPSPSQSPTAFVPSFVPSIVPGGNSHVDQHNGYSVSFALIVPELTAVPSTDDVDTLRRLTSSYLLDVALEYMKEQNRDDVGVADISSTRTITAGLVNGGPYDILFTFQVSIFWWASVEGIPLPFDKIVKSGSPSVFVQNVLSKVPGLGSTTDLSWYPVTEIY